MLCYLGTNCRHDWWLCSVEVGAENGLVRHSATALSLPRRTGWVALVDIESELHSVWWTPVTDESIPQGYIQHDQWCQCLRQNSWHCAVYWIDGELLEFCMTQICIRPQSHCQLGLCLTVQSTLPYLGVNDCKCRHPVLRPQHRPRAVPQQTSRSVKCLRNFSKL